MRRYWYTIILGCWSLLCFAYYAPRGGKSWHFFTLGSAQLFGGPAGLHLYPDFPQLQIGPVAFAVAEVLRFLGPHQGLAAAQIALTAMGLFVVDQVIVIALAVRPGLAERPAALRTTILVGGAVFMAGWSGLSDTFTHVDDAVALVLTALAVRAAVAERPLLVGLCVGLAADSKPWALVFLPLVLMMGPAPAPAFTVRSPSFSPSRSLSPSFAPAPPRRRAPSFTPSFTPSAATAAPVTQNGRTVRSTAVRKPPAAPRSSPWRPGPDGAAARPR